MFCLCVICNGPINHGEPVIQQEDNRFSHRYKHTCDWHKEFQEGYDKEFAKDLKIKL